MNWKELWMTLFGTCEWLGLNMGFWVSMAVVLLIVILMNVAVSYTHLDVYKRQDLKGGKPS